MPHSCCVPQCKSRGNQSGEKPVSKFVTFHQLTKDKTLRKKWIHAIRRDEGKHFTITRNTSICSRHFAEDCFVWTGLAKKRRKIKLNCVPTLFPWNDWGKRLPTVTPRRPLQRPTSQLSFSKSVPLCSSHSTNKENEKVDICPVNTTINFSQQQTATYLRIAQLEAKVEALQKQNELLKERNAILNNQIVDLKKKSFCLDNFKTSDKSMAFYTGLDSERFQILCSLVEAGENGDNVEWYRSDKKFYKDLGLEDMSDLNSSIDNESKSSAGRPRAVSLQEAMFITLVRLRRGMAESTLAHLYGISQSTISTMIITFVNFLFLKLGSLNIFPTKQIVRENMASCFKSLYPETRIILDATEITIETPSSLSKQSMSFSSYKQRNTLKGLIGISPTLAVCFVSQLYTGSISDREITERSGVLDLPYDVGDCIMADKGFTISDLVEPKGLKLNIPPFLKNRDALCPSEVIETQEIASVRIHVERAIRRVKSFHILDGVVDATMYGSINQIWSVCCLLTNLMDPLIDCSNENSDNV